ncbi:MAG: hypothetical protein ACXVGR_15200, partial [Mycobacteriaceae bacterium]
CSGAVTANYGLVNQHAGNQYVSLQSVQLHDAVQSGSPPSLVFLTFGGNDIHFSDIVTFCVVFPSCQDFIAKKLKYTVVPRIADDLAAVYEQVDSEVNTSDAIRKRNGHVAPIVILPYVRILPQDDANAPGNCFVGFDPGEVRFLNQLINQLNQTIQRVVQYEVDAGRPLYYAADVVDAFQPDHSICAPFGSQYANTSREWQVPRNFPDARVRAASFVSAVARAAIFGAQQLAHPNADGYHAEAEALAGWSQHAPLLPVTGPPPPGIPAADSPLPGGLAIGVGQLQPAGGATTVQGSGFLPGTQVVVRLQSFPRVTGAATVAANGTVTATSAIPLDTSPGAHHVVLEGLGANGQLRTVSMPLRVLPPWTDEAVLVLLFGLALLVGGAVAGRRRTPRVGRRRRRGV